MSAPRCVIFSVADRRLALPGGAVRRVVSMPRLKALPTMPPVLEGVMVLGGAAVPVLRLDVLLGVPRREPGVYTPLLLLHRPAGPLALLVDRVHEMAEVPADALAPVGEDASLNHCVSATWTHRGDATLLLDPDALLSAAEEVRLAELRDLAEERLAAWQDDGP
ncbi:chemotaxis protein CheW [Azospirillum halopraeferens]|uniref:chemotaxis protein CheW n=1 Tax=Azospirillum halopraeferens TaxID=34010 RepID=UPI0004052638|nr:chemotaxis protein CheW [Azospirillum halopraeferens]